jgi:hypothetical protein
MGSPGGGAWSAGAKLAEAGNPLAARKAAAVEKATMGARMVGKSQREWDEMVSAVLQAGTGAGLVGVAGATAAGFAKMLYDRWREDRDLPKRLAERSGKPDPEITARLEAVHNDATRFAQQAAKSNDEGKLSSPEVADAYRLMLTFESDLLEARQEGPAAEAKFRRHAAEVLAKARRKLSG